MHDKCIKYLYGIYENQLFIFFLINTVQTKKLDWKNLEKNYY